jgi:glycosyltransferase involved in cell wall biosynthesis
VSALERPISVLHVQKFSGISGSEGHLLQLLTGLTGHRVVPALLMLGGRNDPSERAFVAALEAASVRVDRLPIGADFDPLLVARLTSWFRRERPTIVHTHLVHADVHAGLAARFARVPVLMSTKHNDDRFRRRWPIRAIEAALARHTTRVITISEALRTFYLAVASADPSRVTTIKYGYAPPPARTVDTAAVRRRLEVPADTPLILAVGRLVPQKGHDILIRALRKLPAAPLPAPHVVIAGEGPRRAALTTLARDLGVADRVHLLGQIDDVAGLMHAATLLAHPARWEGFGLVLLEAMAHRLPIVAAAASAIPEVVAADESGLLVPPDDDSALAAAIGRLLHDPRLGRRLADHGHRRLVECFAPERMVRDHLEVYETVAHAAHVD